MNVRPVRNGVIAMLWPVLSFTYAEGRKVVAWFFDYGDAVSFVNAGGNSLYIGEALYDHLARTEFEPKELPNGRFQVAA